MQRYDWREFQEFLSTNQRLSSQAPGASSPALFVSDSGSVVSGYCQNEDLEEWQGTSIDEAREHYKHREHLFVPREAMAAWLREAWEHEGYYEQMVHLRKRLEAFVDERSRQEARTVRRVSYPHFLLESLQGWWSKLLPSSYGLYVRVEPGPAAASGKAVARKGRDFFVVVRRGRFEEFGTPDLTALGRDRAKSESEVVRYLSEKHLVTFQGAFLPEKDWEEWSRMSDPWKLIALSLRAEKLRLVPFRWGVGVLVGLRAYLGI